MKPGEIVAGRYRLDARLGIGGMGEVWRATHTGTGRVFALKFMHAHAAASENARQRFAREARVSARINHPNVIDVFDVGDHDEGTLWLAMELLDGVSLADALHLSPPLSVRDLFVVMLDVAQALAAAHAAGVVHRDVKPANIFLHKDRATGFASAKVLDFGISKASGNEDEHQTKTGSVLGSPRYMSPEQTRASANVDPRADLWSCGVILFEGLTGTWPHEGDSFSSLVVAICTVPPASIDVAAPDQPEAVRSIVRACLQPLDQRIPSAAALAERLRIALQDPSLADRPLARPLHAPAEAVKASSGVRVRPLLTTTAGNSAILSLQGLMEPGPLEASRPSQPSPLATALLAPLPPPQHPPHPSLAATAPEPPFKPLARTVPLGADMREALVRRGLVPPAPVPADTMTGTLETLATTTLREPPPAPAMQGSPPPAPPSGAAPAPARAAPSLRLAVAALSVLLVGIVLVLVSVLRSAPGAAASPTEASTSSATEPSSPPLSPPPLSPPPPATAAQPAPTPPASASASAAPAVAGAAPADWPKPVAARPPPPPPPPPAPPTRSSKVKQLGSGL